MSLALLRTEHPGAARVLGPAQAAFARTQRVQRCLRRRRGAISGILVGMYLYLFALAFRCAWALGLAQKQKESVPATAEPPRVIDDTRLNSYGRKFLQQFREPCGLTNLYDAVNLAAELFYRQQDAVDREL